MKERTRNISVGLTVLVALCCLGGMILLFAGLPWLAQPGYVVYIRANTTYDTHVNDAIHMSGMRIGRVSNIEFADPDNPGEGVVFTVRIHKNYNLPGNTRAYFYTRGLVGAAYVELKSVGDRLIHLETGQPIEFYPRDASVVMPSVHVGGGAIPKELADAIKGLSKLADNISELIAPSAPEDGEPATAPAGLKGTLWKLDKALEGLAIVLGDQENQANLKTSLANMSEATAAATKAMKSLADFAEKAGKTAAIAEETAGDFSQLARKLMKDAENVSKLMSTINRMATKVEAGEGTAGKLLSDPELYNSMLDATDQLAALLVELRQLIEKWRAEGVDLKLK